MQIDVSTVLKNGVLEEQGRGQLEEIFFEER